MRDRHVRRRQGLARVAGCIVAVAALASFLPASTASSAEPNPRTVTVSKSSGLRGGEEITVSWTGFSPGLANVLQCNPEQPLSSLSTICVAQNRVRAVTGANGTGSATIRLRVGTSSVSPPGIRCYRGASCSVVVTECAFDVGAGRAASAPISFDDFPPEYDDEGNLIGDPSELIGSDPPPTLPPVEPPLPEPPPTDRPKVTGGGSESVSVAADVWQDDIRFAPIAPAMVDYTPVNSPTGLGSQNAPRGQKGFVGGELDFALSGMPLSSEQRKELDDQKRGAVLVPLVANALTLTVNGRVGVDPAPITDLRLSATAVHKLYDGTVDPNSDRIVADNLGCRMESNLPKVFIPVYRGDQSADNLTFTSWLKADAGASRFAVSTHLDVNDSQYQSRQGNEPLAAFIAEGANAIKLGYVGLAQAKKHGLALVAVKNRSGAFVLPTAESVGQSVKGAKLQDDGSLSFDRADPNPGAYPLTSVTYAVVPTTLTSSFTAEEGAVLRDYLTYAVSAQGQAKAASLGYFGLPPELLQQARDAIAKIPASAAPVTEVAPEGPPVAGGLGDAGSGGFDDVGDTGSSLSSGGEGAAAPTDGGPAAPAAPVQESVPTAPEQPKRPVPIGDSRLLQGGGLVPPLPLLMVLGLLLLAAGRLTSRRATSRA